MLSLVLEKLSHTAVIEGEGQDACIVGNKETGGKGGIVRIGLDSPLPYPERIDGSKEIRIVRTDLHR